MTAFVRMDLADKAEAKICGVGMVGGGQATKEGSDPSVNCFQFQPKEFVLCPKDHRNLSLLT